MAETPRPAQLSKKKVFRTRRSILRPSAWIPLILLGVAPVLFPKKEASSPRSDIGAESLPPVKNPLSPGAPGRAAIAGEEPRIEILSEILQRGDDNDPRLDRDFQNLTQPEKRSMEKIYQDLPMEDRNKRGLLVFLLGDSLQSQEDLDFFRKILDEPPCLSLQDCSHGPAREEPQSDAPDDVVDRISREYPQLMAIQSLEKFVQETPENDLFRKPLREQAARLLRSHSKK